MIRKYRIKLDDMPKDEYEATFIPYRYKVQVKGWLRWHTVKVFADFDEDWAIRRCQELIGHLEDDGSPVELPGAKEARLAEKAKLEQDLHIVNMTFSEILLDNMHNRFTTGI